MYGGCEPMNEKDWQAEDDARVLGQAAEVKSDPERVKAAKEAAIRRAAEKEKEAKSLRRAARGMNGGAVSSKKSSLPDELRSDGWTMEGE